MHLLFIQTEENLGFILTNEVGSAQFAIPNYKNIYEIVETDEEVVQRYKILIEDIDGEENLVEFASVEYFPNAKDDHSIIMLTK